MEEFVPVKKKQFMKNLSKRYVYIAFVGIIFLFGVSYSLAFFNEIRNVGSGSFSVGGLTYTVTNRSISLNSLAPSTDSVGINSGNDKVLTIVNTSQLTGNVSVSLTRTSGLAFSDLRYALYVNNTLVEVDDVPNDGVLYESVLLGQETINIKVTLWPKSSYSGGVTSFVGELQEEVQLEEMLGASFISSLNDLTNNYVKFNCDGATCETWRIVKVESGRIVLTRSGDYENATSRTNSEVYDSSLTYHDDTDLVVSQSTDTKNVYLAKTVRIVDGNGTNDRPYVLANSSYNLQDKKVIAVITYKDGTTTLGTQNIYYDETNYISRKMSSVTFQGWTDGVNDYALGDVVSFTTNTILLAKNEVNADNLSFNNTITGFNCTDAQCALEALNNMVS